MPSRGGETTFLVSEEGKKAVLNEAQLETDSCENRQTNFVWFILKPFPIKFENQLNMAEWKKKLLINI